MSRFLRKHKYLLWITQAICLIIGAFELGNLLVTRNIMSIHTVLFAGFIIAFLYLKIYERQELR